MHTCMHTYICMTDRLTYAKHTPELEPAQAHGCAASGPHLSGGARGNGNRSGTSVKAEMKTFDSSTVDVVTACRDAIA